jgi:hypothetical protein
MKRRRARVRAARRLIRSAENDYARAEANARKLVQAATGARHAAGAAEALLRDIESAENRSGPSDELAALRDDTLAQLASFRDVERTCRKQLVEFELLKEKFRRHAADAAALASD